MTIEELHGQLMAFKGGALNQPNGKGYLSCNTGNPPLGRGARKVIYRLTITSTGQIEVKFYVNQHWQQRLAELWEMNRNGYDWDREENEQGIKKVVDTPEEARAVLNDLYDKYDDLIKREGPIAEERRG